MMIAKDDSRPYKLTISFILAVIVTAAVKLNSGYLSFLDSMITGNIQGVPSGFEKGMFTFISFVASPKMDVVWILLIAFFLWGFKYKIPAFFAIVLVVGGNAIGIVIKHFVARPRPPMHMKPDDGFSYPSGHVLGAFLIVAVLWILVVPLFKRQSTQWIIRTLLVIGLFLVMVSRIYLNAHYPSDTIGALLIGYTWLEVAEYGYVAFAPRLSHTWLFKNTIY